MKSSVRVRSTFILASLLAISGSFIAIRTANWIGDKIHAPKGVYSIATDISSTQEIERVIDRSVYTSKSFVASQIAKKILAAQIESGGTTFTIYRFNFPQTCGKAGCLHVVVDERDRYANSLQLIDLPDKSFPFSSVNKKGCFNVRQPLNDSIDDYEICKPS
ncbi:hypothetical protein [Chamaesiphon sp.]|uniref:hypothetical protein n=1 Tax=Chamaesiphon sp. TaxID=2814140 RepID=UPI003593F03D